MDDAGDSDFEESKVKTKAPAKRKSVAKKEKRKAKAGKKKKAGSGSRASGRKRGRKPKCASSEEEEESVEELEDSSEEEEEDDIPLKVRKVAKLSEKSVVKKKDLPKVGEMIVTSIRRLREKPRLGSTLAAIKGFMAEEWGLHIPDYTARIKKFLLQAVESGEVVQTRGKGASGRFTVPGMKAKKKKRTNKLTKKWDEEQEPEYEPRKTTR